MGYGRQAGGTHPTGMLSVLENCILSESLLHFLLVRNNFVKVLKGILQLTIYTQEKLTFWQNYTNLKFERYLII